MVTKIFITAVLVLVSWQTLLNLQLHSNFSHLKQLNSHLHASINESTKDIQQHSDEQSASILENFQTYITLQEESLEKSAGLESELKKTKEDIGKKNKEISDLKNLAVINGALRGVLQAEVYSMYRNSEAASSALLATKGPIYKFGTQHPAHKDALIGLMGPIDSLAASWKNGDHKKSSAAIRKVLQDVIKNLSA